MLPRGPFPSSVSRPKPKPVVVGAKEINETRVSGWKLPMPCGREERKRESEERHIPRRTPVKYIHRNRRTWLVHSPSHRIGSGPLTHTAAAIAIAPRLFTGPGRSHNLIVGAIRCHDRVLATTSSVSTTPPSHPFHTVCVGDVHSWNPLSGDIAPDHPPRWSVPVVACVSGPFCKSCLIIHTGCLLSR